MQFDALELGVGNQIKERLLQSLGSSVRDARHTSAQVIASIAAIDIPRKDWSELIAYLLDNIKKGDSSGDLKQSSLETLGLICKEISHSDLRPNEVDLILTAVVHRMRLAENRPEVCVTATKILQNFLKFAKANFQSEREQNHIMEMVYETALSKEVEVREAAFECLASIASTYYDVLEAYMQPLFELTSNAVKGDVEPVALQAIKFWRSVCDKEIELQGYGRPKTSESGHPHSCFIERFLPLLVPMLMETLLKQEEDVDQHDSIWNISSVDQL